MQLATAAHSNHLVKGSSKWLSSFLASRHHRLRLLSIVLASRFGHRCSSWNSFTNPTPVLVGLCIFQQFLVGGPSNSDSNQSSRRRSPKPRYHYAQSGSTGSNLLASPFGPISSRAPKEVITLDLFFRINPLWKPTAGAFSRRPQRPDAAEQTAPCLFSKPAEMFVSNRFCLDAREKERPACWTSCL